MTLPPPPDPKKPLPHLSHSPWAGFTPREHKRAEALGLCPNPRCRRLKACVAAHDGLYCQRTHLSHAAYLAGLAKREPPPRDLELRRLAMIDALEQNKAAHAALTARWKAGEFDHLYGKWRARGALVKPPPKQYVEPP